MNIFLINHYAGSSDYGMEYRPYYLAKEWQKKGHKVTIIAASFSHVRIKQPNIKNKISNELVEELEYCWIKTSKYNGNGVRRFINILQFVYSLWRYSKYFSKKFKPDIVIASSTYPLDIYPARKIAKLSKAKLVYEVHDLWPLSLIELGGLSRLHPIIILFQAAENFAYKHSDKVVSILPKTLEHMQQHGMDAKKFVYIPNGINIEEWNEKVSPSNKSSEIINQLKGQNKFLIAYAGAHGLANALESFIKAALLLNEFPIQLILIGSGPEKEKLIQTANSLKIKNVTFLEPIPKKEIPVILSLMDGLFIGLQNQPLFRFGISPNKLLDYMMAGKPIIQAINAGNDLVTEAGCGFTVEPENSKDIANAILKLYNLESEERIKLGNAGKEYVLKNNDYKILAEKFINTVEEN